MPSRPQQPDPAGSGSLPKVPRQKLFAGTPHGAEIADLAQAVHDFLVMDADVRQGERTRSEIVNFARRLGQTDEGRAVLHFAQASDQAFPSTEGLKEQEGTLGGANMGMHWLALAGAVNTSPYGSRGDGPDGRLSLKQILALGRYALAAIHYLAHKDPLQRNQSDDPVLGASHRGMGQFMPAGIAHQIAADYLAESGVLPMGPEQSQQIDGPPL